MKYRLDHIALNCNDISESVRFYETVFDGKPTAPRQGGDGHKFYFIDISGAAAIQLSESPRAKPASTTTVLSPTISIKWLPSCVPKRRDHPGDWRRERETHHLVR